jgi:hypothetical protein
MLAIAALLLLAAPSTPTLYEQLGAVRKCHSMRPDGDAIACDFKLPGLNLRIDSVGDINVGLSVEELNPKLWAQINFVPNADRCITIFRAVGDPPLDATAQINLDSARVYPDNKTCRANKP